MLAVPLFFSLSELNYAQERRMGKINLASGLLDVVAVCDEHWAEVFQFMNIIQRLTIKQDGLALPARDECYIFVEALMRKTTV